MTNIKQVMLGLGLVALLLWVGVELGQANSDGCSLTWFTIDGGGGQSEHDGYSLTGTIGQPDTGISSGGGFELQGGFWVGGSPAGSNPVYLPLVIK